MVLNCCQTRYYSGERAKAVNLEENLQGEMEVLQLLKETFSIWRSTGNCCWEHLGQGQKTFMS